MKPRSASERPGDLAELEAAIAYRFADRQVLAEALTHASAMAQGRRRGGRTPRRSYERLEFLGDRVLGLAVAHLLIEAYPDEAEGGLTHRQSMLVCRETLAGVAEEIGLGRFLLVAHGGRGSGIRRGTGAALSDEVRHHPPAPLDASVPARLRFHHQTSRRLNFYTSRHP